MFNKFLRQQKAKLEQQVKSLTESIDKANITLGTINGRIEEAKSKEADFQSKLSSLEATLDEAKHELGIAEGLIEMQDLGIEYEPAMNNPTQIAKRKQFVEDQIGNMATLNQIVETTREYRIDGSSAKGRQFQKTFCDNLIVGFNAYFNKKRKAITQANFVKSRDLIEKKFDTYNKKASMMGVKISSNYLSLCTELLRLDLDEKIAKAEEKERLKEERRRLREHEKMLAEAEKTKAELQKERRMYEQSLSHALDEQERLDFEAKLKEIDKREADVDYRVNNARAGYLYVTATKAMPGMTKIGVTRRLNPLVRIQELSSASVAWPFVCYGLVFCDDAFDLETRVHAYFDKKRVKKENKHKEFFYISPKEAIDVLQNKFKCEVHFVNESEED